MTTKLRRLGKDLCTINPGYYYVREKLKPDQVKSAGHQKELIHSVLTKSDLKSDLLIKEEQAGNE